MKNKKMLDRVFVINLERRPERLQHFLEECRREHVPQELIHVWQAVDGLTHTFPENELSLFQHSDLDPRSETGRGCMANQLSHLQILRFIVAHCLSYSVIFQDDVRFGKDFWSHLQNVIGEMHRNRDLEIVWIGLHDIGAGSYFRDLNLEQQSVDSFISEQVSPSIGRLKSSINPASLAYVITLEGAKQYLSHIESTGIRFATDINYREYLLARHAFYGAVPMLCTGNSAFKSDIFQYDDHAIARDLLELLNDT